MRYFILLFCIVLYSILLYSSVLYNIVHVRPGNVKVSVHVVFERVLNLLEVLQQDHLLLLRCGSSVYVFACVLVFVFVCVLVCGPTCMVSCMCRSYSMFHSFSRLVCFLVFLYVGLYPSFCFLFFHLSNFLIHCGKLMLK